MKVDVGAHFARLLIRATKRHFVAVGENLAVALCPRDTLAGVLLSHLPRVLSVRRSLIVEPILYRGALLPLSEDGDTIDHVLGAANHRALLADDAPTKQVTRTRWV